MTELENNPFPDLIRSYDSGVSFREADQVSKWKEDLRWNFLAALQKESRSSLIDIGAGTGVHALFFQEQGQNLHCIDLSPALIEKCREKGLSSQVLSVLDLKSMNRVFEAAFAMNSLLHIPSSLLPKALSNIAAILNEEGLFYWGQYGGKKQEGIYEDDHYQPKRFFSLLEDDEIQACASQAFSILSFDRIQLEDPGPLHFQSLLLRVKPGP